MNTPLVSVLIPCYNAEVFLETALQSITDQTYDNLEIILVDDGSTDESYKVYKAFEKKDKRFHIIKNKKNLGLIATLNKAVAYCNGTYIARMDADDISVLNRIENQVNYLTNNPDIAVVGTNAIPIDVDGNKLYQAQKDFYCNSSTLAFSAYFMQPLVHGSIIAKAEVLKNNPYSTDFYHSEDFELWLRLVNKGFKIANLDKPLYYYRRNPQGVSNQNELKQKESHNKASKHYLEKHLKSKIESNAIAILNYRLIKNTSRSEIEKSLDLLWQFYSTFDQSKELKRSYEHLNINIYIQLLKTVSSPGTKLYVLMLLSKFCVSLKGIGYLLTKFRN